MLASAQIHFTFVLGQSEIKPLLFAVALICGITLVIWRRADAACMRYSRRFNAFLASFSFTLYLIHFPVALFIIAGIVALSVPDAAVFTGFQPLSMQGILVFVGAAAGALGAAIVGAAMTEWRTAAVRMRVLQIIKQQ